MDNHVRIAELQKNIKDGINIDEQNILFEFSELNEQTKLEVITINPKHAQSFLFHTTEGNDKISALEEMLNYVKKARLQFNSYTVQWSTINEDKLHTSYFRAKSIVDALNKFHYGRDESSVIVFSVVLNPIA